MSPGTLNPESGAKMPLRLPPEATWYDTHYQQAQPRMPDWYQFMLPDLLRELNPTDRLLELGCGQGHVLRFLAHQGTLPQENIFAVDQSRTAVEFVAQRLPKAHVEMMDICALRFPERSFRFVLLMETIEHVPDPAPLLQAIHSVLQPGGMLYLSFPNYFHLPWWVVRVLAEKLNHPNWVVLQPVDHIYTVFGVRKRVQQAGLRFERGFGSIYGPPLLYQYEPARLTRFLNRLRLYPFAFHPILKFRKP